MISPPKPATLKRYGLTLDQWRAMVDDQGGACAICRKVPSTGRLVIDHEHVKGWKKMPPEKRVLYVRGACCTFCNRFYLAKGITTDKAKAVTAYLETYASRRPK